MERGGRERGVLLRFGGGKCLQEEELEEIGCYAVD